MEMKGGWNEPIPDCTHCEELYCSEGPRTQRDIKAISNVLHCAAAAAASTSAMLAAKGKHPSLQSGPGTARHATPRHGNKVSISLCSIPAPPRSAGAAVELGSRSRVVSTP